MKKWNKLALKFKSFIRIKSKKSKNKNKNDWLKRNYNKKKKIIKKIKD